MASAPEFPPFAAEQPTAAAKGSNNNMNAHHLHHHCAEWRPDGRFLAVAQGAGAVSLYSLESLVSMLRRLEQCTHVYYLIMVVVLIPQHLRTKLRPSLGFTSDAGIPRGPTLLLQRRRQRPLVSIVSKRGPPSQIRLASQLPASITGLVVLATTIIIIITKVILTATAATTQCYPPGKLPSVCCAC